MIALCKLYVCIKQTLYKMINNFKLFIFFTQVLIKFQIYNIMWKFELTLLLTSKKDLLTTEMPLNQKIIYC